jgi:TonB-dependent starch-binding outer membrane protein SusC
MKKILLLSISFLFLLGTAWAQRTVTGRVTSSDDGSAIPGVNVILKGTSTGTITDFDGNYRLEVPEAGGTLVFSFIGLVTQENEIGSRSVVDASMNVDVSELDEIVVTGYGTQEKKEVTSAVSSVKAKDFNKGMVNDPLQLIQGKVGGLTIVKPGGDPNGSYTLRLRGVSTFGANASPLIVIDGVIGGSLNTVDPNDIAAIDVLKDGSAAAIYGSRGSAGVILITTKTGQSGKATVEYNGSVAFENVANSIEFMDAAEYKKLPGAVDLGGSTDWLDEVTGTGVSQIHNVSLSGGNNSTTYRASVNVRDVTGVGINSGYDQINTRLNLQQKALNNRMTISVNLSATTKDSEYGFTESFRYAIAANPTMPVYSSASGGGITGGAVTGGYSERDIFDFFNPVSISEQNINNGTDLRLLGSAKIDYDFSDVIDGFSAGIFYSQQRQTDERAQYFTKTSYFVNGRNGVGSRNYAGNQNELFETTLNYSKTLGGADLSVLAGYSYQEFFAEGFGMRGSNFLTDAFTYNNMGASLDFPNGLGSVQSYANSNKLVAFFGRVNLNFSDNYFVSASVRQEGSTRFGADNKWGLFPAVSAGVNLDNILDLSGVDQLKLRASWGKTGAQPADSYLSLRRYGPSGSFYYGGAYVPSYGPQSNPNPDLKWEEKDEFDVGVDFAILNGKLSGSIDWYQRVTSDLLFLIDVPVPPNLYSQTWKNVGEMTNSGVEITLNYEVLKTSNVSYSTSINFATFKTIIDKLEVSPLYQASMGSPGQSAVDLARVAVGEELGQLWLPVYNGPDPDTGAPTMKDLSGDGSYCDCNDDKQVAGNGLPDFTLGWNNSLNFGNFDLNIFFRGAFGHDILNSYRGFYENYSPTVISNWNVVKGSDLDPSLTDAAVNDTHVESGSFVKLDNATLGYTLPLGENKVGFRKMRIYLSVQNAFVLTGYTGIDPEVRYVDIEGNNALAPGIERRNTYFTTNTVSAGINIGF